MIAFEISLLHHQLGVGLKYKLAVGVNFKYFRLGFPLVPAAKNIESLAFLANVVEYGTFD